MDNFRRREEKTSNNREIKLKVISIVILIAISVAGCSLGSKPKPIEKTNFMLDTMVMIQAFGDEASQAIDEAFQRVADIENKMTLRGKDSEIIYLNEHSGGGFTKVSSDTFFVIQRGKMYSDKSQGRFDITIGPLAEIWGIGTENAKIPSDDEIQRALKLINYRDIELDEGQSSVRLKQSDMSIDLGGIAKGYAADEVAKILKQHSIESALIDLGGNIYVIGSNPQGKPWKIGLQDPSDIRGGIFATVEVIDKTLVTSGSYERFFEKDGKRYHHILDTSTGFPVENNLVSVTIISDSSIDADAISTAAYSLGLDDGMLFVESLKDTEAIFVTEDYQVYKTSGLQKFNLNITKAEFALKD